MHAYRVRGWDEHYENNRSRERDRCRFVCLPNKQDGLGLARILAEKDGTSIYGTWCLILGACSRHRRPRQGHLTDTGRPPDGEQPGIPWTASDLALLWRRPEKEIARALTFLASDAVGWLSVVEISGSCGESARLVPDQCPPGARPVPARCPPGALEGKGREGKGTERTVDLAADPAGRVFYFWVKHMGKARTTLPTQKRLDAVRDRLQDGFSEEDLCDAIRGCRMTPHNMGQNDRRRKFNDLELICRTPEQVEGFIETYRDAEPEGIRPERPPGKASWITEEDEREVAEMLGDVSDLMGGGEE